MKDDLKQAIFDIGKNLTQALIDIEKESKEYQEGFYKAFNIVCEALWEKDYTKEQVIE